LRPIHAISTLILVMAALPATAQNDAAFSTMLAACASPVADFATRIDDLSKGGWVTLADSEVARERMYIFGLTRFPKPMLDGGSKFAKALTDAKSIPLLPAVPGGKVLVSADVQAALLETGVWGGTLENPGFDGFLYLSAKATSDVSLTASIHCSLVSGESLPASILRVMAPPGASITSDVAATDSPDQIRTRLGLSITTDRGNTMMMRFEHFDIAATPGLAAIRAEAATTFTFGTLLNMSVYPLEVTP
jgi:hypothetical protein